MSHLSGMPNPKLANTLRSKSNPLHWWTSRTEAEHPQPRFGEVKMTEGGPQPVLPAPASTTTTEAAATKSATATEPPTTAAEILESALSPLG